MNMVNNITSLSTPMSQSQLMTNVSTAVLDMALDTFEGQASELIKLMESSVQPDLGQNFDMNI